jgi:hypothetical protein
MKIFDGASLAVLCACTLLWAHAQMPESGDSSKPAPVIWSRNDVPDPMARGGPILRITGQTPRHDYRMAMTCENLAKENSGALGILGVTTISLTIRPENAKLRYKLYYVPPRADVTVNQISPYMPATGSATITGGYYEAMPRIRFDNLDPRAGDGNAKELNFSFLTPIDARRMFSAGGSMLTSILGGSPSAKDSVDENNPIKNAVGDLLGTVMNNMAGMKTYSVADLRKSQRALIEQEFEDGSVAYITLDPQDSTVQSFIEACVGPAVTAKVEDTAKGSKGPPGLSLDSTNNVSTYVDVPKLPLTHAEQFEGTLAEFDAQLPQLLQRAALKWKLPVHDLDPEAMLISRNATLCSGLTPQVVAALSPTDRNQLEHGHNYPKRQACEPGYVQVSKLVRAYDPKTERGVVLNLTPVGGSWEDAQAVEMKILLTGMPGDDVVHDFFDRYGLVDAKIRVEPNPTASLLVAASPNPTATGASSPATPARTADTLPPPAAVSPDSSKKIVLTRANPAANGSASITAPGRGNHHFNIFYVDTQDFADGGTLNVDITVDRNSQATGAFNLFKGDTPIPTRGYLPMSVANAYEVPAGGTGHLRYHFERGTILAFGAEGNWADKPGVTGDVSFHIAVSK